MKNLKLFSVILMLLVGIGQVWADPSTYTWTLASGDLGTAETPATSVSKGSPATTWSVAWTWRDDSKKYLGFEGSGSARGLQIGKGTANYGGTTVVLSTSGISGTITSVKVNAAIAGSGNAELSVTVGSDDFEYNSETVVSLTTSATEYEFEGSASGDISISLVNKATGKGMYLKSIEVTYSTGGGSGKDDLTDGQLSWSAASANITYGDEPYSLPSLTNSIPVSVTYQSTDETVATISDLGAVSVLKAGSTTIKAVFAGDDDYNAKTVSYTLTVAPAPLTPIAGGVVDELIVSDFGVTSGSYTAFTDKQASNEGHSDAVYAGKVARNGNSTQYNIQMNTIGTSTAAGREIATSTSGGYAKRVQAIWATQTTNTANRKLTVYGSESAYTGSETVATGTKLGDLTYTSGDTYAYLDIDGDYPYIQIVASGAIYMDQINVTWVSSAAAVAKPAISGDENFLTSTEVSITCATDGATIYYTTNGSDPKTVGTEYSGPFSLTESATVHAIANFGSDWSEPASKTFTKATVLTVAEAIAAIPNKDDVVNNQYVAGIVCTAAPSLLSDGKLTYYISDDGSETNRLQIYKGKNLNNTEFTAVSDLAIGDRVTVFGQLKNFNNTPEMNDGNYLVSKAAPAVAAPTFSPDGGGFMGETDVTITCATGSSTIYYTLDGTTPTKLSSVYGDPIHLNATTTITAVAYVGDDASLVIAKTFTLTAPMTVAEALAALDSEDPINNVAVAGIISTAPSSNPSSGKLTYYISDDGTDTDELEVFNGYGLNGASFSAKTDLQVGDEVTVFGNLTIFNSTTKEFASGSRLLAFNRPQVAVTGINLTESTAEVEEGKTVTLHASVVPANATNKTIVWSVQSGDTYASVDENGVVTGIAAGEAVIRAASDEDATIFAECTVTVTEPAPLSPWATTYTSNITLSVDENDTKAYAEKVKITVEEELTEFSALRAATGSAAGECHVIVPAGTQTLHFHAAAWNGKASTVTVKMGETTLLEQALTSDAGIANSSPYTLSGNAYEYYYSIDLSGYSLAEETRITFSVGSDKRFVLFGVNQVGGLVLESISVSGTATALEYNDGDHFSPAGLSVIGHYSDASTAPISEGIDWAFDPDPLTEGTTSVSVTATAGGFTSDPFVVDGLTVAGAAPLSPWATTYTSNITLSVDENDTKAYAEKVKITVEEELTEFSALRAATGSAAGECHVIVPAGTQTLHFHAAAWNGKASTVTVKMGETTLLEQALTSDAGIANSSPYTLSGNAYEYYYSIDLSGYSLAEETRITFSVGSDKRFVLFGVNQEGGVVPVLKSIEISGDLTTKSGYKAGDALDLDGLAVSAIYTLNDVDQAPVDVTSLVNWSYDPLVEGQTSVTITATLEDKSDDITISDLEAVASADPKIYVDKLSVTFDPVVKDAALPANQTITVTLTNVAAATATLGGTNPDAFSIDPATLTGSGDITISVIASTAAVATYSAKITITDDAAAASSKTVNLSFSVTAPDDDLTGTWNLVTDAADLKPGVQVMITGVKNDKTYAMAAQTSSNRTSVEGTLNGTVLTPNNGSKVFTLVDAANGKFALQTWQGEYLYASSSSANQLKTRADITADAIWTISLNTEDNTASIVAEESSNRNVMQFNNSSTNALFACYASASQSALKLYANLVKISGSTVDASTITNNTSVVVPEGTTLTSGADKTLRNVIIKEGGVMRSTAGMLNVNDVTINSMAGKSGQLIGTIGTNVNINGDLYMEIQMCNGDLDANYWYCIAVPFDVDIQNGVFLPNGTKMNAGADYEVWIFDPQKRAQSQANGWKRANGKMEAGRAYLIGFNPGMPNTVRLKAAPGWKDNLFKGSSIPVETTTTGEVGRYDNWNGIANPTMKYTSVGEDDNIQVFDNNTHSYSGYAYNTTTFVVGTPFFVQRSSALPINNEVHSNYRAPKREAEKHIYGVRITRADAETFDNQIIIRASEEATNSYEAGRDMLTLNDATSKTSALLWTENYGGQRLAIENAPLVNNSAVYTLGIYAPADGDYTISADQGDANIYLTYEGRVIWDLTAAPYTLNLTKGSTAGYGLRIIAAPRATTDIENIYNSTSGVQKVMLNGTIFILRGEQMYDATGRMIK